MPGGCSHRVVLEQLINAADPLSFSPHSSTYLPRSIMALAICVLAVGNNRAPLMSIC